MKLSRLTAIFYVFVAVACGPAETLPPDLDAGLGNNADAGDAGDAGDTGKICPGTCAPTVPGGWLGPALFWSGAEADAPLCADVPGAPSEYYTGHADSDGPLCGACKCASPLGACTLPATMTAAAASCAGDGSGVAHTSFDAPESWDGLCSAENAIPVGKLCGGVPCVQSVTIAPLTLKQGGCLPIEPPKAPPPSWKTFTRACVAEPFPRVCGREGGGLCVAAIPSSEFRLCVMEMGNPIQIECPPDYPDRSIFYQESAPYCSPCACGVPNSATCTSSLTIFKDGLCGAPLSSSVALDAKGPTCADVPPGSALGSKVATAPDYYGGYCVPSGGAPKATVVCCRP